MSNKVNITGNVAAEPRFFEPRDNMQAMASFPIASNRLVRGENMADGYFDVAVYGPQARTVADRLKTGARVVVDGRLKQSKRQDGTYHVGIVAYAVAESLEFAHRDNQPADEEEALAAATAGGPARDEAGRFVAAG